MVDIVYIALNYSFSWTEIMKEAAEKDLWINAIEASKILDGFPSDKLEEIHWVNTRHDIGLFENRLRLLISDLLTGEQNSLFNNKIAD